MLIKAPAKINLTLRIISKRADGYHEISSKMQAICLFDDVEIHVYEGNKGSGSLSCKVEQGDKNTIPLPGIPEGPENLAWRAAELAIKTWKPDFVNSLHTDIVLKKNIPTGAGLAGGSSNAAAVFILSFSSSITRWAVFLPTPGALLRATASCATMDRIICCGVIAPRIAEATFGPIPETEISKVNRRTSSCVRNPCKDCPLSPD